MHQMYKKAQAKCYPWESDNKDSRFRMVWFSLLFAAFFLFLYQTSTAQKLFFSPDPDDTEIELNQLEHQLSRSELRTAKDYQEIISKLEFYIRHHLEYFSEYDKFAGRKYQNYLLQMMINIEKGVYCADADHLIKDLSKLTKSLKKEERNLKKNKSLIKLYKNVRTLRSDLECISDILTSEISSQLTEHESSIKDIKIFLHKEREVEKQQEDFQIKMYALQEKLQEGISQFIKVQESLKITFDKEQMREMFETKDLQKELEEVINMVLEINIDSSSVNLSIPAPPVFPVPPVPPVREMTPDSKAHYTYTGKTSLSNRYQDSILVKSGKIPIYIDNQLGDIEVQGWDGNKIIATYSYEVTADSRADAKDFVESITLALTSDKSGIYVETGFPSLHNTKRQVLNSYMVLYVPKKNEVNITNSFGRTEILNINNDINIKTKNSDLRVENVTGSVSSQSKHGSSFFKRINGDLSIDSNRGKITVEDANSTLDIVNSYAPILIEGCRGNATLKNSGKIEIYNHSGNIDIQNENGKTTIQTLNGNLTLTGSFKPFFINSVNGSVDIVNKNAVINLSQISGKTIVSNKSGNIKAQNIEGPFDFTNFAGEIYFITDKSLRGNSVINSDYGTINIILPQESNIILQASTDGGSILNSYNTKIKKDDFFLSTTIALGDKSNKLEVSGTNSTIIIKDSQ